MKIEEIIKQQKQAQTRDSLPHLQIKVLHFFERHKGEVFTNHDSEMLNELNDEKMSALGWATWALEKKGFLNKLKVGRKTHFGLPEDIKKLHSALIPAREKPKSKHSPAI
jgi:hypothetical protein